MKLLLFVGLINTAFTKESCNDFEYENDENIRVTSWTTPVEVRKIEDSESLQEFSLLTKIDETKKDLKKIIQERKEYKFMFPLLEHDNRIGGNHFLRHNQKNDLDYYNEPKYKSQLSPSNENRLQKYLKTILRPKTTILDLAASWQSHLPEGTVFENYSKLAVDGAFGSYSEASGGRLASLAYTPRRSPSPLPFRQKNCRQKFGVKKKFQKKKINR